MWDGETTFSWQLSEAQVRDLSVGRVSRELRTVAADMLALQEKYTLTIENTDAAEPTAATTTKHVPAQKPGRSKQDYGTPPAFLSAVKRRFGLKEFAIDLAASQENAVAPLFYTEVENALKQPWRTRSREMGWCNPPFANIQPWVEKAYAESKIGARVAMLVPAGVGSNWWRDWVHGKAFVLLLNGRITFVGETQPYPKDCCLLLYGPDVSPGYDVWSWTAKSKTEVAA